MKKTVQRDMTKGSPTRIILGFTLPLFLGNVFQQFYNMADTIIVGQFVGTGALAAVGSTGTIMFLITGFATGLGTGFTILTAQRFGAGDMKGMRRSVFTAAVLTVIVSVLVTAVSVIFMHPLLGLMQTPADIYDDAYAYIIVIMWGLAAQMLYNLLSALLRAIGNSRMPPLLPDPSGGVNVVLDLVFIINFKMGTAGAAYATVISQGVSGLLCLLYIVKAVPIFRLSRRDMVMDGRMMAEQLKVGLPMALQFSITAIGSIMVQTSLNMLGSTLVAAYTAAGKIEQILTQAYVALGTAMANYSAQNVGAGDIPRIRQGFRAATIWGSVYSVAAGVLIMTVGKYLTYLFVSEDAAMLFDSVDLYLKCIGFFFIPLNIVNAYRNGLQGLGYGLLPMTAGVAELAGRGLSRSSPPGTAAISASAWPGRRRGFWPAGCWSSSTSTSSKRTSPGHSPSGRNTGCSFWRNGKLQCGYGRKNPAPKVWGGIFHGAAYSR